MESLEQHNANGLENIPEHHDATEVDTSAPQHDSSLSQRLEVQNTDSEYCIPCAMMFDDESSYASHLTSEEHAIMILVTGIGFFERDPEDTSEFPPLYYCVLCNVFHFDFNSYEKHLGGFTHTYIVEFMRITSFCKEKIIVGAKCKNFPSCAEDFKKLSNYIPNYCQLCCKQCNSPKTLEDHTKGQGHQKSEMSVNHCQFCNILYANPAHYEDHLKTDLHIRIKDFMQKMLITEKERMGTPKKESYVSSYGEAIPRPSLYFCKLCNIEFNDVDSFRKHRNISIHRRVEKLVVKMSIKAVVDLPDMQSLEIVTGLVPRIHYCELCKTWCSTSTQTYENHVKSSLHLRNKSAHIVQNWECLTENQVPQAEY